MSSFFQQYTDLIWIPLLLAIVALGIILRSILYEKHIASNGKITVTPRFKFKRNIQYTTKKARPYKPYNNKQRQLLARLFTLQASIFGLTLFLLGLIALRAALVSPVSVEYLIAGIVCAFLGVLLIYQRNRNNPFR